MLFRIHASESDAGTPQSPRTITPWIFASTAPLPWLLALLAIVALSPTAHAQDVGTPPQIPSDVITLRPGDEIRVSIWREEDLSGKFQVDENGVVTLPLLGQRPVVDVPFPTLRDALMDEYRVHLRNPAISITPLRRVNVLGEVNQPGLYSVDPTISLAGVVAMAGGTNPVGDLAKIRILRNGVIVEERASATSTLSMMDVRSGDQILVERRGWFDRNSTFVVSALLSVTSIVISITR